MGAVIYQKEYISHKGLNEPGLMKPISCRLEFISCSLFHPQNWLLEKLVKVD